MPSLKYSQSYTREELERSVKQNVSIMGVIRTLGAPSTSGSFRRKLTQQIQDYKIDTSHFLGLGWNKGLGIKHKGGSIKQAVRPDDYRLCSKCQVTKLAQDFYQRKKGLRIGDYYEKCKDCMKSRGINYFYQNHIRQLQLAKLRKSRYVQEREKWLIKIKDRPCKDCGIKYPPYAMDFDHLEGEVKIASISHLAKHNTASFEKIEQEIKKCELVCANCHRIRTYDRIQKRKNAAVANVVKAGV